MNKTFKGCFVVLLLMCLIPGFSFADSGKGQFQNLISTVKVVEKTQLYTAYNLFTEHGLVRAINFRVGDLIPTGTPVKVEILKSEELNVYGREVRDEDIIHIKNLADGKTYTLEFTARYHPGKTIYDYANLMFGKKTFEELTAGKTADVINAIRRSAVVEGMTKEDVILSYGYPAEHRTPSLGDNTWTYWNNRFKSKQICFDREERAISCEKRTVKDL